MVYRVVEKLLQRSRSDFLRRGFTREIQEHAKARGVKECLSKPFSFKEMIKAVRKVLQEDKISYNINKQDQLLKDVVSVGE